MKYLSAHNRNTLLSKLTDIDIEVPLRGSDRTTEHTERWSMCRLLSTLAWKYDLEYPLIVTKSERPDYILEKSEYLVGVEVTEAVKEDMVRAQALHDNDTDEVLDTSLFKWRDRRKTNDELRGIKKSVSLTGPGWEGDEREKEFADAISDIVEKKSRKLLEETYQRGDEDWLVIYDNLALHKIDRTKSLSYLCISLDNYWSNDTFDRIYIESGE